MQPTLCSRCHKNVAVIFVTRIEGGETKNEGLCLKCAKELGIKPVEDMMKKMGISEEDLEGLTNEMMSAFGGALLGLVKGCAILFLCAWVLRYLGKVIPEETVEQTRLLKFFMTTNPVALVLGGLAASTEVAV